MGSMHVATLVKAAKDNVHYSSQVLCAKKWAAGRQSLSLIDLFDRVWHNEAAYEKELGDYAKAIKQYNISASLGPTKMSLEELQAQELEEVPTRWRHDTALMAVWGQIQGGHGAFTQDEITQYVKAKM